MNHDDHVALIRGGLDGAGPRWLELGAGEGAFTLALADILGRDAEIVAMDQDAGALRRLAAEMERRFPAAVLTTVIGDFRGRLPDRVFDGVLAANSLHFVNDPVDVLARSRAALRPAGRLVVVEYDADRGNPWVPHPFSVRRFGDMAAEAGFVGTREIGRHPSRFLGAIYAAAADRPAAERPAADRPAEDAVLHSRP